MEYDKICHILASYAIVVSAFAYMRRRRMKAYPAILIACGLCLTIGAFKELCLDWEPDVYDMMANTIGMVLGAVYTVVLL